MFDRLSAKGFDIATCNHAGAILSVDFPKVSGELETALLDLHIPAEELIGSGGGEAPSTQRLRRRLYAENWPKHHFDFRLIVDGRETVSNSHEIDHVRRTKAGTIALEIEWNNKDPFFDRDLENFQRLHAQSAISVGVLITRGASLQDAFLPRITDWMMVQGLNGEDDLDRLGIGTRTASQRRAVADQVARGTPFAEAFARKFVADKFGQATTHW